MTIPCSVCRFGDCPCFWAWVRTPLDQKTGPAPERAHNDKPGRAA